MTAQWPRGAVRDNALAAALVMFASVFGLRMALGGDATDGVLMMLGFPVALVAVARGLTAGLAAAAVAAALVLVWAALHEVPVSAVGYLSRATTFFVLGGVIGYAGDELRRHAKLSADAAVARRDSEEQLRVVVESVIDHAIFMLDRHGRIASWNEGARRIAGYAPDEIVGQHLDRLYPPEDREGNVVDAALRDAARTGHHASEGWRLRRDGSCFRAAVDITPQFDGHGAVRGFTHVLRDVSGRVEAEDRVRRSERQLAEAQRVARMGSWEWDVAADRVSWSDQLYAIFATRPADSDHTYDDFVRRLHPHDRDTARRAVERALAEGRSIHFEARIVRPDGDERLLAIRGETMRGADGTVASLLGTAQDVTQARQAEAAFARAQERFDQWFDGPPTAMALVSLGGRGRSRILQVNAAMTAITGRAHAGLLGAPIDELLDRDGEGEPEEPAPLDDLLAGAVETAAAEELLRRRAGDPVAVKLHGWLLRDERGAPLYAVLQLQQSAPARDESDVPVGAAAQLTARELEVIRLAADGLSGPDVAERLHLSPETIKDHLGSAYRKLGVNDRAAAVARAIRARLID